jgi:hypothetical protein
MSFLMLKKTLKKIQEISDGSNYVKVNLDLIITCAIIKHNTFFALNNKIETQSINITNSNKVHYKVKDLELKRRSVMKRTIGEKRKKLKAFVDALIKN